MYEYEMDYNTYSYNTTGFDAEGQITSAIAGVSSDDIPKLYTLTGHGEISLDAGYKSAIEKENIVMVFEPAFDHIDHFYSERKSVGTCIVNDDDR